MSVQCIVQKNDAEYRGVAQCECNYVCVNEEVAAFSGGEGVLVCEGLFVCI